MASICENYHESLAKEKLRNIADLTSQIIINYNESGKTQLYREISEIWTYLKDITNVEVKIIKDLMVKMSIAFEAFLAGAISRDQLITFIVKNEAVSSLINNLEIIS